VLRALGNPDGTLPAAELEVEQIAAQFASAKVATGEEGTRGFVDAFSEDVMHFATHGTVNFRKPHTSYLLLAGEEHLAAQEIARDSWDKASLVVLSACNTGNSSLDFVGHRSLAGAFLKSGSPTVLATLWQVDDSATRVFMNHFYTALSKGDSPQESVKNAQLELLGSAQFQHPYYWAGFLLFQGIEARATLSNSRRTSLLYRSDRPDSR
jgi:CHAT domain-containing protein